MQRIFKNKRIDIFFYDYKIIIILCVLILISILFLLKNYNLSGRYLIILISLPFLLISAFDFKFTFSIFILSFFYETSIYYFSLPLLLVPILFISFVINYKIDLNRLKSSVFIFFFIFLLCILPSYFVSIKYIESWLLSYNLIAFITVLCITIISIENIDDMKLIILVYLWGTVLSSVFLIVQAILIDKRVFGFSGVMFVDLIGIGLVISYSHFLIKKEKRTVYAFITLLLLLALVFTQTRNAWLSSGIVLSLLSIHFMIINKYWGIHGGKAVVYFALYFVFYSNSLPN